MNGVCLNSRVLKGVVLTGATPVCGEIIKSEGGKYMKGITVFDKMVMSLGMYVADEIKHLNTSDAKQVRAWLMEVVENLQKIRDVLDKD